MKRYSLGYSVSYAIDTMRATERWTPSMFEARVNRRAIAALFQLHRSWDTHDSELELLADPEEDLPDEP